MGLAREQRLTKGDTAVEGVALSPEEYFLLSRVEGSPTVAEIVAGSGLAKADAERILDRLVEVGVLVTTDAAPPPKARPRVRPSGNGNGRLRDRAQERRKRLLAAQFGAGAAASSDGSSESTGDDDDDDDGSAGESAPLPMVEAHDPRINGDVPISLEEQRWILALADGHETISPFEFLGLRPTHDDKAIKRAYHNTSRKLHPDSYYGKDLGVYKEMLADLFRRARFYYAELRKKDVRTPYVDAWIEESARRKLAKEAEAAAVEEAEREANELRRQQEEAEAAVRRQQRAQQRAERKRERLRKQMANEASNYLVEAEAAEKKGNLPKAANLYRLALRADPNNAELQEKWETVRDEARSRRAADAFTRAQRYDEMGHANEAAKLYLEAADALPTAEHLAHATEAIASIDKSQARDFAMAALDALTTEQANGKVFKPKQLASMRMMIARGFWAAGLQESGKQQALMAKELRPNDPEVRALLKAMKVK